MPASETSAISLGGWIGAFPVTYALAAVAVAAASAVFIERAAGLIKRGRLASGVTRSRIAGSEA